MFSFSGTYHVFIDIKGRINLPSKFIEVLNNRYNNTLVLFKIDDCIVIYPEKEWEVYEENVLRLSSMKKNVRDYRRIFYSRVQKDCILKHGKILIPQSLREYANLNREVVLLGASTIIEIWSKEIWDEFIANNDDKFEELAEEMANLG
jgi:MraZ protein